MKDKEVAIRDFTPDDLLFDIETEAVKGVKQEDITIAKEKKKAKQRKFLACYISNGGQVFPACKHADIDHQLHTWWKRNDPAYLEAFEQAEELTLDAVNAEIVRRGLEGFEEPVFYKGEKRHTIRKWSDNLLMFRAKRLDPAYRDNYNQNVNVGTINIRVVPPKIEAPRQIETAVIDGEVVESES